MKFLAWSYGLILFLLPIYLVRSNIFGIPTTALEIIVGVFLLSVIIIAVDKTSLKKIKRLGKVNWAIGLFIVSCAVSVFVSPEPIKALGQLKAFIIEPILLFYAGIIILNKDNVKIALRGLFWSAVLISLFGIIQYWTHLFLPLRFWGYGVEVERITSVFEYPNALALYLAPLFVFFLALEVRGYKLLNKYTAWIGLSAIFFAIVLTSSRGAWIATTICVIVMALTVARISVKRMAIYALVVAITLTPFVYPRFKLTMKDGASSERISLYQASWEKIKSSPITGNGLYGFRTTLQESPTYSGEILNYPHNIILNFYLETGVFGLLAIAWLIYLVYKNYARSPNELKYAAGIFLLALIVHGMFDAPYFKNDLSIIFWFIVALIFI